MLCVADVSGSFCAGMGVGVTGAGVGGDATGIGAGVTVARSAWPEPGTGVVANEGNEPGVGVVGRAIGPGVGVT